MKFVLSQGPIGAALLLCAATFAAPVIAAPGVAKEAVPAQPGQSVEASARQRARELNHDSVLRGVGQGKQSHTELTRGQASVGTVDIGGKPATKPKQ